MSHFDFDDIEYTNEPADDHGIEVALATPAALQRVLARIASVDKRLAAKCEQIMAKLEKLEGDR